jgi:twinkle protein
VDNLMTARFSTSADRDFFRAQSNFTGRLVEFAKKFEVHVHLVAHPRKSQGALEADDVSGSGDITNRADNVFSLDRLDEKDAQMKGYTAALKVLKNRVHRLKVLKVKIILTQLTVNVNMMSL